MLAIDETTLYVIAPKFRGAKRRAQKRIMSAVGPVLADTLNDYAINTPLRIAHCLAQLAHESAGFRTTEEFASGAAYEGRADLGNTQPGDGRRYKGRGLIQLTGRANYRQLGQTLDLDLEGHPEKAAEPALSLVIACEYWKSRAINDAADTDDLFTVTRRINGGLNGLADRRRYLIRAKRELARLQALDIEASAGDNERAVLRRGQKGEAVADLQRTLQAAGYPIAVDGDFGPATNLAVRQFQIAHGLAVDGIVGPQTWSVLDS